LRALQQVYGKPLDQLSRMIDRINDPANTSLNKHEVELFDAARDVTGSPYGGQCLSFLSFHIEPGSPKSLLLTAQYRNHYYVEKLLGNMIGLGRLMSFIAKETGMKVGSLTIVSTNAEIDLPKLNGKGTRQHFTDLIAACKNPPLVQSAA
jgi:thymidylate synthase